MSENNTALIIRNDQRREISFTDQAKKLKADALEASALIAKVPTNADENEVLVAAQRALVTIEKAVEKARVEAKAPVLAYGQHIDDTAKAFKHSIKEESMRLAGLAGSYQQLLAAKAQAEAEARRLEAERIEREQREEQQRILRAEQERLAVIEREKERLVLEQRQREAEALRASQEADRKIREAANAQARKKAEAEAAEQKRLRDIADAKAREEADRAAVELKRQQELAQARTHEELDAAQERASNAQAAIANAPTAAPVRAEGQRVTTDWTIEVTDSWLLARAHPTCVDIVPKLNEIKSLLNVGVDVKGVRATKGLKSTVAAKRTPAAIDV